jgi:hypothetical protein
MAHFTINSDGSVHIQGYTSGKRLAVTASGTHLHRSWIGRKKGATMPKLEIALFLARAATLMIAFIVFEKR